MAAAVLSGNRNYEGRIHALVRANYLASPPLVVAYALAGRMDIDLETEPLGTNDAGEDIFLRDIWPDGDAIRDVLASVAGYQPGLSGDQEQPAGATSGDARAEG